jgi:primosomal protein N' (replication factor Y)
MFAEIALPLPLRRLFDYQIPNTVDINQITMGARVTVPFGRRTLIGIIINVKSSSEFPAEKIKPILEILDKESLFSPALFDLLSWSARYYQYSLGEVLQAGLPNLLRKASRHCEAAKPPRQSREPEIKALSGPLDCFGRKLPRNDEALNLNRHQQAAFERIQNNLGKFQTFLLDGITGSGKTEVYLQILDKVFETGKQALVLVPEIALTPQTLQRFQKRFGIQVAVYHSTLTDKERFKTWMNSREGTVKLVLGTRSSIFLPFKNLGLLIVDEEHDSSFKQQESFRYSARDLAVRRAQSDNIPIILGSATPSLESYYNAQQGRYVLLNLPERAGNATPPSIKTINMRRQSLQAGLTPGLLEAIQKTLANNNQVLLFLNRRGFSSIFLCHDCGWIATCKRCDAYLTLHQQPSYRLHCHHCDANQKAMKVCLDCKSEQLIPVGVGTQQLEHALTELFPNTEVIRIDRDSTRRKGALQKHLDSINTGDPKILIGTQMLAKGHHFPRVTLVGILNADNGFFSSDFRSLEHTAQLIMQVSGRAGRAEQAGQVFIQTHHPEHPLLHSLIEKGYTHFLENLLQERQEAQLPPFSYIALLRAESIAAIAGTLFLKNAAQLAEEIVATKIKEEIEILGPVSAPMEKRAGRYRAQLLFRAKDRGVLQRLLSDLCWNLENDKKSSKVRWSIDVDPQDMT